MTYLTKRNGIIAALLLLAVLFLGNFHVVTYIINDARPQLTIIGKDGFYFRDSFISLDEVIRRSNIHAENFIIDPKFNHLVGRLFEKELITRGGGEE